MRKKPFIQSSSLFLFFGMLLISGYLLITKVKAGPTTKTKKNNNDGGDCFPIDGDTNERRVKERIKAHISAVGGNSRLANIFIAHTIIETGHYKSNIYRTCNNPFGMGRVYFRKTTQCGYKDFGERVNEPKYMGKYDTLNSAIDDWFLWFNYHGMPIAYLNLLTLYQILAIMKKYKYFVIGLDEYYRRVDKIYKTLK